MTTFTRLAPLPQTGTLARYALRWWDAPTQTWQPFAGIPAAMHKRRCEEWLNHIQAVLEAEGCKVTPTERGLEAVSGGQTAVIQMMEVRE